MENEANKLLDSLEQVLNWIDAHKVSMSIQETNALLLRTERHKLVQVQETKKELIF